MSGMAVTDTRAERTVLERYGRMLLISHANSFLTAYAHNSKLLVDVGDHVDRGQRIAAVGSTGNVTSPQLHFEIRKGAQPVDPMPHLQGG